MRLTDLNPRFLPDSSGHEGVALCCDCPCGSKACLDLCVPFDVALDGTRYPVDHCWHRVGDTFETLTLTPSIQRIPQKGETCRWHGFITNGEVITV